MLVLLPPSETKAAPPQRGTPVDYAALSFPTLTDLRQHVMAALIEVSAQPDALTRLGVGPSLAAEVARNLTLLEAPTRPAHEVYTGVLYDALGWSTLSTSARRRGAQQLLITSALWGLLTPKDQVPSYRLSMGATLPAVGPLARHWREELSAAMADAAGQRGVVVDCRSGPYAAAAPLASLPLASRVERAVAIRVLREENGKRSVVSHLAKHTRGEVARHLLETGADPSTPAELAEALGERWTVELAAPARTGQLQTLSVVLH